jgi:hypothetical protein
MSDNKTQEPRPPTTRDAVETAIDLARDRKSVSWDELARTQRAYRWPLRDGKSRAAASTKQPR